MSDHSSTPDEPATPDTPYGYLPPQAAFQPAYPAAQAGDRDPLIPFGGEGISGWLRRITEMFRRSWRSLFTIFALTQTLPGILIGVAALAGVGVAFDLTDFGLGLEGSGRFDLPEAFLAIIGVVLLVSLASLAVQMIGYGAATYAATREAAGIQVSLGEALRYGARRCLGLLGWLLLVGLILTLVIGALVACGIGVLGGGNVGPGAVVLPLLLAIPVSIYVMMLIAMVAPAYLFERGNALGRGFQLLHGGFGAILGRLSLLFLALLVGSCVTNMVTSIQDAGPTGELAAQLVVGMIVLVISSAIELPLTVVQFTGVLLTYTGRRGDERPITTGGLVAELDGVSGMPPPHQWQPGVQRW